MSIAATIQTKENRTPLRVHLARIVVALAGAGTLLAGITLLLAPVWFFEHIGPYSPFNRHYEGDLGAFLIPLGVGLLIAAREPWRHRLLVAVAASASLLHAGNHVFDSVREQASLGHWLGDTVPLLLLAGLLLWVVVTRDHTANERDHTAGHARIAQDTPIRL
jgi:hypothetical protein